MLTRRRRSVGAASALAVGIAVAVVLPAPVHGATSCSVGARTGVAHLEGGDVQLRADAQQLLQWRQSDGDPWTTCTTTNGAPATLTMIASIEVEITTDKSPSLTVRLGTIGDPLEPGPPSGLEHEQIDAGWVSWLTIGTSDASSRITATHSGKLDLDGDGAHNLSIFNDTQYNLQIEGGAGNDWFDTSLGGGQSFLIMGGGGGDALFGHGGPDVLDGGDGADLVAGDDHDDWLSGGAGDDWLYGGNSHDHLVGGLGTDHLYAGNGGLDTCVNDAVDILSADCEIIM